MTVARRTAPLAIVELQTQAGHARGYRSEQSIGGMRAEKEPRTAAPPGREAVTYTPVEEHITERAIFSQGAKDRKAERAESALVQRFAAYLKRIGPETTSVRIQVDQEIIRADLLDRTVGVLFEAKASPDRQKIRMAIGQLLDYQRFLEPEPQLRVLIPLPLTPDICPLLASVGIGATWPEEDDWCDVGVLEPAQTNTRGSRRVVCL